MVAAVLGLYLDIYHHKLYPLWPIVDATSLRARLEVPIPDVEAYMLASSVCAATILQLQLAVIGTNSSKLEPKSMISEIEDLRRIHEYREQPSLDALSTSFFLHIAYLHLGRRTISTLLLREAISLAHMLDLHQLGHYAGLSCWEAQDHLRKLWLLFITERAHATQYDLPCIVTISPTLPALDDTLQPFTLAAFVLLCEMFRRFQEVSSDKRHTAQSLMSLHNQLQQVPILTRYCNDLQRADLSITQQWMRLMFWKLAVTQVSMTAGPSDGIQSMLFPVQIAGDLLSSMSVFSIDTLEAHGPGMELKLFEFVNTLANVMVCVPHQENRKFELGPHNMLVHLAGILGNFRGGNNALLPILQSRMADVGLSVPAAPRFIDVTHGSADSGRTRSSTESDETLGTHIDGMNTLTPSHLWAPEQSDDHYAATDTGYFDTLLPIARDSA
ncbi:hypothetical protein LTR57_017003 [Friedmanniomyces endolithicus]|nr:hypothetical protein LTR75_003248 [Friedmanniomyces endolithicus]KAK0856750.1 hypothetical protein LTR03_001087 [Friedmanniomyces endolithicus]KAK0908028.1 hypothetical protein LTR57_017003 [Friedmanniomyces endolithicus]KAK0979689.1 hypothetical protein LTS01_012327 [Friedmanniomyces endolithicus]